MSKDSHLPSTSGTGRLREVFRYLTLTLTVPSLLKGFSRKHLQGTLYLAYYSWPSVSVGSASEDSTHLIGGWLNPQIQNYGHGEPTVYVYCLKSSQSPLLGLPLLPALLK